MVLLTTALAEEISRRALEYPGTRTVHAYRFTRRRRYAVRPDRLAAGVGWGPHWQLAWLATTAWHAMADAGTVAPIHELCDALLTIMRNGKAPFGQRADQPLAPVMDRVFDLASSNHCKFQFGPSWSTLAPQEQSTLLTAFRRYTLANYVSNFTTTSTVSASTCSPIRATCPTANRWCVHA